MIKESMFLSPVIKPFIASVPIPIFTTERPYKFRMCRPKAYETPKVPHAWGLPLPPSPKRKKIIIIIKKLLAAGSLQGPI